MAPTIGGVFVDTHCHVSSSKFDDDRNAVVARALESGVDQLVDVGCDLESSKRSIELARSQPVGRVFSVVGVHPHEARHFDASTPEDLARLARSAPGIVVAVGECGLDFYYDHSPRDVQAHAFREQLRLAWQLCLPVVLHVRDAHEEALAILDEMQAESPLEGQAPYRGVAHCYSGDANQAARYQALGLSIALGGVLTFKNAAELREVALVVGLESIVLETDCPYLAPAPQRGKRNEPSFLVHTARMLADVKGLDLDEVARITSANARGLFSLPDPPTA